jgi:hypothetical protein
MDSYKVLSEISYASRKWNAGEVVQMPAERAEKFLATNAVELIPQDKPASHKSAKPAKENQ